MYKRVDPSNPANTTVDFRDQTMLGIEIPYYMKFWRHFNLAILAIFQKIAKLKCTKIKCR